MASDRQTIAEEVNYTLGNRDDIDDRIDLWVRRAYQQVQSTWEFPEAIETSSTPTVPGTPDYDLPDDYFSVYSVRSTTRNRKLIQISQPRYDGLDSTRNESPTHYAVFANDLWLWPTPDAIETIQLRYRRSLPDLTLDTSVHELPIAWEDVIVNWASSIGFKALNELERAAFYYRAAISLGTQLHSRIEWELLDRDEAMRVLGG